jgi:flagellar FliL protein
MMFSVMGASKKTAQLVTNIATVLNIELEGNKKEEEEVQIVSVADTITLDIDKLNIPLKKATVMNSDGTMGVEKNAHMCQVEVTFLINSKAESFAAYKDTYSTYTSMLQGVITEVFGNHTLDEVQSSPEKIKEEILAKIVSDYQLDFIYRVVFKSIYYQ